jgi:uncharacterized NAD(P)/FAD-binding protein YdhS
MAMTQPTLAIIGAGFTGTLLSLSLQAIAPAGTRIRLIEGTGHFAAGPAYATANPNHLLNAPAGRMSAFADQPMHFVEWLQRQPKSRLPEIVTNEATFVPRSLYGAYLRYLLERGLRRQYVCRLDLVDDHVTGIEELPNRVTLLTGSGTVLSADLAVLAVGLPRSAAFHPEIPVLEAAGFWQRDPWAPSLHTALDPAAPVLLVGSGLTMVDTVISLLDAGHIGPIHAISRHGLLPQRHSTAPLAPVALQPLPNGLLPLVRFIRNEAARAADWRPVIDALRPIIPDLWRGFSEREQHQFIRHLRAWWDVYRHRMAPQIADRMAVAQVSGQFQLRAGHIIGMAVDNGVATVTIRSRAGNDQLTVARIVDCTGYGCDISRNTTLLLRKLFRSGLAKPDRLRLGLDVTEQGALISAAGVASERVFAVGPLTRGNVWELTAVPELRRQCVATARVLSHRLTRMAQNSKPADDIAPWLLRFRETTTRANKGHGVN